MAQELPQQFTTYASRDQKTAESFSDSSTPLPEKAQGLQLGRVSLRVKRLRQVCFWLISEITASFFQFCARIFIRAKTRQLHDELSLYLDAAAGEFQNHWIVPSILAGEDHRFFFHKGADPIAIIRAVVLTAIGRTQGGSTIEQQLVRTVTGDYRRSLIRKYKELMLASTLALRFSKTDVIKIYCYVAYFGYGVVGIQAAEKILLANCRENDDRLAAVLISHLKYPSSKVASDEFSKRRDARVLHILSRVKNLEYWLKVESRSYTGHY